MNTNDVSGIVIPGLNYLPHSLQGPVLAAVVLSPFLGRAYHAFTMGGGVKGIAGAIWLGTNTPKPPTQPETPTPTAQ